MMNRHRPHRVLSLALTLALVFSLLAPARAEGGAAFSVALNPASLTLSMGANQMLRAELTLPDGVTSSDVTLEWLPNDRSVVEVKQDPGDAMQAIVTPLTVGGMTTITLVATARGKGPEGTDLTAQATCAAAVQFDAPTGITLNRQSALVDVGKTQELTASLVPSSADPTNVSWSASPESIAKVSLTAGSATVVTAVAPGEAVVTAKSGTAEAKCFVTVPGIVLSSTTLELVSGASATLGKTLYGGISSDIEWSSNKETVAQVSNGLILARGAGTTVITATVKNTSYSATCTVTVKENTAGLITASAAAGMALPFSSLTSELNNQCYTVLGSQLSYITGLSVSTGDGILFYGYASADDPGAGVGSSERYYYSGGGIGAMSLNNVYFVPNADFSGTTTDISYTGYASDNRFFKGIIRVTVERTNAITYTTGTGSTARFQAADFNANCRARNGRDLDYVTFSIPLSSKGTLYYNYSGSSLDTKVTDQTRYYRSGNPSLDSISFVPAANFTGSVSIQYTARDTMGYSYTGRVVVTVTTGGGGGAGDISYTVARDSYVSFRTSDFSSVCRSATGEELDYVRFDLPSSSKGTLYYGYTSHGDYDSKVTDSRSYYLSGSPFLQRVSFVPASGFSGTVEIDFTGWSTLGSRFLGVISITVGSGTGTDGVSIDYSTSKGTPVAFDDDDFDELCRTETGYALSYVRFELPSSTRGTLYYQYSSANNYDSRVSASKNYSMNSSPYLDGVTFVPVSSYTGTAEVEFTGWDVKGNRFMGTVYITIGGAGGTLNYSVARDKPLTLSVNDFNRLCQDQTGSSLKYVRFDLPSSREGALYYKYSSSTGDYESKVTGSMSYYRSDSPYLSNVSFVPADGYTGKVVIAFDAWDISGNHFASTLNITVGSGSTGSGSSGSRLTYEVASGKVLTFNDADFNSLCRDQTGNSLSYVRFELPSAALGTLYYNYTSSNQFDSKVTEGRSYYRSSTPYLSSVSFVPTAGYTGTVSIPFSAWDVSAYKVTGTVEITVKPGPAAAVITYATGTAPVTFYAGDFQSACSAREGGTLTSVVFALPSEDAGKLWHDYRSPASKGTAVSALSAYAPSGSLLLNKVTFVPKAGFSGTVTIAYTGRDSTGASYAGTVQIVVTTPASSTHYGDLGKYAWAVPSVEYLYANNILSGLADKNFRPGEDITRGDFMLMLCRALELSASGGSGFRDINNQYYADAVLTAQALGIAQGDGFYFYPERSLTRQDASAFLHRALNAAGWDVPAGSTGSLRAFTDYASVADYAAAPMASMVELGILKGDDAGRLVPAKALTRAEMSVILHRVMTM